MAQKKSTKPSRTKASKAPVKEPVKKEAEIKTDAASAPAAVDNTPDKLTEEKESAAKETAATTPSKSSQVKEKATAAKEAVTEKASKAKEAVTERASKAKETVTEKASKAKKTVKKDISSAKETAKAKIAKAAASQETYFELAGEQILMEDINERIRQAWLAEGHYPSRLKSIKTYINLEERRAYYVINGKAENKYVEF